MADTELVLFDRDGTLVRNVPYNDNPDLVEPMPGARSVLDGLRQRGVRVGVISNQSGIARGLLTAEALQRVNERVEELLGPFDAWQTCPHVPEDGCLCRKPAPAMILAACASLRIPTSRTVVVGDIEADVLAGRAAGAYAVLVPNAETDPAEVRRARMLAPDLRTAIERVVG